MAPALHGSKPNLTGPQKSAVVCLALGPAEAGKVLKELAPEEIERIVREIATLPPLTEEIVKGVVQEYLKIAGSDEKAPPRGGIQAAHEILEAAVGPTRAREILGRVRERMPEAGMDRLKRVAPDTLSEAIKGEHPQTIAVVLSQLDPKASARTLKGLPPELASDVVYRMARMQKISPEVLGKVETALRARTDADDGRQGQAAGGPGLAAKLINMAGEELQGQLLNVLEQRSSDLANEVKSLMFVFEDLIRIDAKGIQRVLREVDTKELALSLKAASDEIRAHIRSGMSERAASALEEEVDLLGPVRVKDVEAAHARVIEIVRRLEQAGEIIVRKEGAEDDVI